MLASIRQRRLDVRWQCAQRRALGSCTAIPVLERCFQGARLLSERVEYVGNRQLVDERQSRVEPRRLAYAWRAPGLAQERPQFFAAVRRDGIGCLHPKASLLGALERGEPFCV